MAEGNVQLPRGGNFPAREDRVGGNGTRNDAVDLEDWRKLLVL